MSCSLTTGQLICGCTFLIVQDITVVMYSNQTVNIDPVIKPAGFLLAAFFLFYHAMHNSALHGIAMVILSVHLSVTFVIRD